MPNILDKNIYHASKNTIRLTTYPICSLINMKNSINEFSTSFTFPSDVIVLLIFNIPHKGDDSRAASARKM